jgi:hypothetical protein
MRLLKLHLPVRLGVLAVLGMCLTALSEPAATNQSLRLVLTLVDGSRVVGVPQIQSVPLQTEYARMDIPLLKVRKIAHEGTNEAVSIALANGDRVQGGCPIPSVEVGASFGRAVIPFGLIAAMDVVDYGTGGLTSRHALWDESLLGFWQLIGNARDAKGDNHGTWIGTERYETETPAGGKAASFSGNGNAVTLGKNLTFSSEKPRTLSAWVLIAEINPRNKYGKVLDSNPSEANRFEALLSTSGDDGGNLGFQAGQCCGGSSSVTALNRPQPNTWHHYVGVFSGNEVRFYVDGTSQGAVNYTNKQADEVTGPLTVGPRVVADWWLFKGGVANVAVWGRALNAAEVTALYRLGISAP